MALKSQKPTPSDFSSPNDYLLAAYNYQKKQEPGISHRFLAASMGYKSAAAFVDIVKGRVFPSKRALNALKEIFSLCEEEMMCLVYLFAIRSIRKPYCKEIVVAYVNKITNTARQKTMSVKSLTVD